LSEQKQTTTSAATMVARVATFAAHRWKSLLCVAFTAFVFVVVSMARAFAGDHVAAAAGSFAAPARSASAEPVVPTAELVVFTATWYKGVNDVRCRQAVRTLAALVANRITVVVVDGSPDPAVRELLAATGAKVAHQTGIGMKGAALREAAAMAARLPGVRPDTWLCWQEPEKTDMARHWAAAMGGGEMATAAVAVPGREDAAFKRT
jgi:hypothetical protein